MAYVSPPHLDVVVARPIKPLRSHHPIAHGAAVPTSFIALAESRHNAMGHGGGIGPNIRADSEQLFYASSWDDTSAGECQRPAIGSARRLVACRPGHRYLSLSDQAPQPDSAAG